MIPKTFLIVARAVLSWHLFASTLHADDLFRDRVAPLFERRCVTCHNDQRHEGDFSLQSAEAALADGFIEPGNPAASHLIDLITPSNGEAMMPKEASPLASEEVRLIRDWIRDGAKWPDDVRLREPQVNDFDWWSYQPLKRPHVPPSASDQFRADGSGKVSPIDHFVLEKLREKGLTPSPPADRRTLIRRLTYDLIGLPPSPEDVTAFVADNDPHAYEKLVDRLLASPHYGEHWARHWLDVAKYADSCGYDKDKLRPNAWPYRDYVIRSLNEDKPYSRFVQEQIAGDVLFPDDPDGIVALGFIAAGPWDFIGHVEVSESKLDGKVARNLDRDDMVSGAINTFCSLTVQCARCHNHKFDPITQEHYYGLQSVFAAVDRANRPFDAEPETARRRRELTNRLNNLTAARKAIEEEVTAAGGKTLADARAAVAKLEETLQPSYPPEHGYHSQVAAAPANEKKGEKWVEKWVEVELPTEAIIDRIVLHPCHDDFNGIGEGFGFPVRFQIELVDEAGTRTIVTDQTTQDFANPGIGELSYDLPNQKARRVRVTATRLASRASDYIFALAELQVFSGHLNVAKGATVHAADSIEAPPRWSRQNLIDGKWPRTGEPAVVEKIAAAKAKRDEIYSRQLSKLSEATNSSLQDAIESYTIEIGQLESERQALPSQQLVYAAATHFKSEGNFRATGGKPREVFVLTRGEVTMPGSPAVPGVLPLSGESQSDQSQTGDSLLGDSRWQFSMESDEGQRRARLAHWLVDHDNPLVWRSIVNRVWQYHFGEGIVSTPNDFGRMGTPPTHPELLDWLAVEFRDGEQSLKTLHRMIVTSNTYQQSSANIPANSAVDGSNQTLWRANRRRLSAEEIRDSILMVSGAMNFEMGGPGYYLFALEKTQHSPHFQYHKFDPAEKASHRRSIYRFIARSQPNPYMTTLDCADSSQSTPRRNETLTSLQALALLNNKFNLVMAEEFAARLEREGSDTESQIRRALGWITQRPPEETEIAELVGYAKVHGMKNLCRLLFNLSEFVFVD